MRSSYSKLNCCLIHQKNTERRTFFGYIRNGMHDNSQLIWFLSNWSLWYGKGGPLHYFLVKYILWQQKLNMSASACCNYNNMVFVSRVYRKLETSTVSPSLCYTFNWLKFSCFSYVLGNIGYVGVIHFSFKVDIFFPKVGTLANISLGEIYLCYVNQSIGM